MLIITEPKRENEGSAQCLLSRNPLLESRPRLRCRAFSGCARSCCALWSARFLVGVLPPGHCGALRLAGPRIFAPWGLALWSAAALSGSRFFQLATAPPVPRASSAVLLVALSVAARPASASSYRALRRRLRVFCAVRFSRHGMADTALVAHSSDDVSDLFVCCSRLPADELPTYDFERAYERAPRA
jgi:hypothetical protein